MEPSDHELTPLYARLLLRLTRPFPNFDVPFMKPVREAAVRLLRLEPGDRVLDVGCGMGGSFSLLADAVGRTGEVVGVEISPQTVASARRRIARNKWANAKVLQAAAEAVSLSGTYQALIMFAAPDVYGSKAALANILPHLRDGSRIVLFGVKRSHGRVGRAFNPLLKLAVAKLSFATTPLPDAEPWQLVASHVKELEIREYFFGTLFLASGSLVESSTGGDSALSGPARSPRGKEGPNPSIERRGLLKTCVAAFVLTLASQTAIAGYKAATLSADGADLAITTDDGSEFAAPMFSEQVGFEQPRISPNGKSVGWLALYPNCCTSYPIALRLVVLDHERRLHTFEGIKMAIFKWCFLPKSTSVAYMQTVLHGSNFEHFEARALLNGNLLAEYEFPDEETENATARNRAPRWVQCVER